MEYKVVVTMKHRGTVEDVVTADNATHAMDEFMDLHDINEFAIVKSTVELYVDRQRVVRRLSEITQQIDDLVAEGKQLADSAGVEFTLRSNELEFNNWYESGEWQSSDSSCW